MISYCVLAYRGRYFYIQMLELIKKTSVPYEILVWINCRAPDIESFTRRLIAEGFPVRLIGISTENVGMLAYKELFQAAKYDMIVQLDDDVHAISRRIAEKANDIFVRNPNVKQLVGDVIQDRFTTGSRPKMDSYEKYNPADGLFDGPIDGWFSIYHRSGLDLLLAAPYEKYFYLGSHMWLMYKSKGLMGCLCTKFKVFHICGPTYAQLFDMLEFEIMKYFTVNNKSMAQSYRKHKSGKEVLDQAREQYIKNIQYLETF